MAEELPEPGGRLVRGTSPDSLPRPVVVVLALALVAGTATLAFVGYSVYRYWVWLGDPFTEEAPWFAPFPSHGSPEPFEPEPRHLAALFGLDDLSRAAALGDANGDTYHHAVEGFDGWYVNRRFGDMGIPGVAVACALDVTESVEDGRKRFEIWRQMQGFESGATGHPAFRVRPIELRWGDDSLAAVLYEEGEAVGNSVLARSEERVMLIEWRGRVVAEPAELAELVTPSLDAMDALER